MQQALVLASLTLLLGACSPPRPEPVLEAGSALALSVDVPFALLELPEGEPSAAESPERRVRQGITHADTSRAGLALEPPARVAWDVEIPPAAELHFAAGLVPRRANVPASGSFMLRVEVEARGRVDPVFAEEIDADHFRAQRIDLSRWSGESVRLLMHTEGELEGAHAFIADPVVVSRAGRPRRVVILFIDTLRADHLGLYGYEGGTSRNLDAFADSAVVFERARSVAPWTLPSARSLVTGRVPEAYGGAETLPARLRGEGFATAMFASNQFLDDRFDMQRGWGLHHNPSGVNAALQARRALTWLGDQEGRDVLLLVHFMDPHLPYREPLRYRSWRTALDPPIGDGLLFRRPLNRLPTPVDDDLLDYLRERYDNNIRYVDDALGRIFSSLEAGDVVIVLSDHGEEFWEHGAFEHGHSLHDEVLRVPMILRAPGLAATRVAEPVSLMDVTPSVLELLGLEASGLDGVSLLAAIRDEDGARAALARRTLVFGRPLYGRERWGVLRGGEKLLSDDGVVAAYDLAADPFESAPEVASALSSLGERLRGLLGASLGRDIAAGFQLAATEPPKRPLERLRVSLRVPGGIEEAWVRPDPRRRARVSLTRDDDEWLHAEWQVGRRAGGEIFIVPRRPPAEIAADLELRVEHGETLDTPRPDPAAPDRAGPLVDHPVADDRRLLLTLALVPRPRSDLEPIIADDEQARARLRALGYELGPDPEPAAEEPSP